MKTLKRFAFVAIMMAGAAVSFTSCSSASKDEPKNPAKQEEAKVPVSFVINYSFSDPNKELTDSQSSTMTTIFNVKKTESESYQSAKDAEAMKNKYISDLKAKMVDAAKEMPSLKTSHVTVTYSYNYTYTVNGKNMKRAGCKTLAFSDVDNL